MVIAEVKGRRRREEGDAMALQALADKVEAGKPQGGHRARCCAGSGEASLPQTASDNQMSSSLN